MPAPAKGSNMECLVMGEVYREDDWPHGLSCGQCPHVFSEGDRYSEALDAFVDEFPLVRVVCLGCATRALPT